MATRHISNVIQELRRDALRREGSALTDAQLLEQFLALREEAALEVLVRRHGPMVWGVCRRVLHHLHDAEDAFQATFLVLVQKARAIRSRELLANWLYGVAWMTARRARSAAAKRRWRERQVAQMPEPAATATQPWDDLRPLLDLEVSRLPEKYRVVVVLCDLEGKSHEETARQLGWPVGTVAGRLSRARQMLGRRLARRGLPLAVGTLAGVLKQQGFAGPPPALVSATVQAAGVMLAGHGTGIISAQILALMKGTVRAMWLSKVRIVVGLALTALLAVGSAVVFSQAAPGSAHYGDAPQGVVAINNPDAGPKNEQPNPPKTDPKKADDPLLMGTTRDWELTAKLVSQEIPLGEPVRLVIILRNNSKANRLYGESSPGFDYFRTITIRDDKGKEVPRTAFGKPWQGNLEVFKLVSRTLEPGQQVKFTLNLSLAFEFAQPGNYTIQVKAPFIENLVGDGVSAKPVQVKITNPGYPLMEKQDWLMTKIGGGSKNPKDDLGPPWNLKNLDKRIKELSDKSVLDLIGEDKIASIVLHNNGKPIPGEKIFEADLFVHALRTGKIIPQDKMVYHLKWSQSCLIRTPQGNYTLGIYYEPVAYIVLPNGESYWFFFGKKTE